MNLFELSAALSLDTTDYEKSMSKAEKDGKSFLSRVTGSFERMGKKWLSFKLASQAVQGFFAPITNAVKNATKAYADYEQLVGGVETLFKESADRVLKNSRNAFRTAGKSMNEYMETTTSFAAAMISGLQGDTQRAAEMSNMAIVDMADNVNKMGSSMESVENAYRGFSKQNYTMLDNLKLGYGGTKKEMERLLADAEKLTGRVYDISNFADIVEAIHAVQTEMGITGTTAKEAESTITGSLNMVKAAWQNVMTAMADPDAVRKLPDTIAEFSQSAKTYLKNLLPIARQSVKGLGTVISELAPVIGQELPGFIVEVVPAFAKAGGYLAKGIFDGIVGLFKGTKSKVKDKLLDWLGFKYTRGIRDILKRNSTSWKDIGKALIQRIGDGIKAAPDNLRQYLSEKLNISEDSSWRDIGRKAIEKIREGITNFSSTTQVWLGQKLGLCDSEGNPVDDGGFSWIGIGKAAIEKIKEGVRDAEDSAQVWLGQKLGLCDANGNPVDGESLSWINIGKNILLKIREGVTKFRFTTKVWLGEKLGLCDEEGNPTDGEKLSWLDIGKKVIEKIRNGITTFSDNTKIWLGEKLGLCDSEGNPVEGEKVSWGDVGGKILEKIRSGLTTASAAGKNTLGYLLGLTDKDGKLLSGDGDVTWGAIGKDIFDKLYASFESGGGFLKRLVSGNSKVEYEAWIKRLGRNPTWSEVVDSLFTRIQKGLEGKDIIGVLFDHVTDKTLGLVDLAGKLLGAVSNWMGDANNKEKISAFVTNFVTSIVNSAATIITALTEMLNDTKFIENLAGLVSLALTAIINALPTVIDSIATVLTTVLSDPKFLNALNKLIPAIAGLLTEIFSNPGIISVFETLIGTMAQLFAFTVVSMVARALDVILTPVLRLVGAVGNDETAFQKWGIYNTIDSWFPELTQQQTEETTGALSDLAGAAEDAADNLNQISGTTGGGKTQYPLGPDKDGIRGTEHMDYAPSKSTENNSTTKTGSTTTKKRTSAPVNSKVQTQHPEEEASRLYGDMAWKLFGAYAAISGTKWAAKKVAGAAWNGIKNLFGGGGGAATTTNITNVTINNFGGAAGGGAGATGGGGGGGAYIGGQGTGHFSGPMDQPGPMDLDPMTGWNTRINAKGLWTVPYDDYVTRLHRNEMVLTASQARDYKEGDIGSTSAIVTAIQELRNDMTNLRIFVGKRAFGQTVVDYSGKRLTGYMGRAEDRAISGYGWG